MPPATGTAVYTRRPEAVGVAAAVIEARLGAFRDTEILPTEGPCTCTLRINTTGSPADLHRGKKT
jgi:hypothetical protein